MSSAKQKALEYLGRFARTQRQVALYLSRKGFSKDEIAGALSDLRDYGYLNDQAFAASFIQSRIDRCDGPMKIQQMLFQKGVDPSTTKQLLSEIYPAELQQERATVLLRKKKGNRNQLLRFVASRGFPRYVIIQALQAKKSYEKQ